MFFYALTAAGSSLVDVSVQYRKTMSDHYCASTAHELPD